MKKRNLLISLSMVTSFVLNANANSENLGEITVEDTAFETHVKSIDSEKLENLQASDIKDILKSLPSVVVDGNARYSQKVYVRGLEDKSSNITIDGAKISGQLFHHSGDQTIDAEMLKIGSIELGPNSALSGAGVINGSFVYETKDPSDFLEKGKVFGGKISAGYESAYHRKKGSVAVFSKVNDKIEFVGIGNISKDGELSIPSADAIKSKESKLKSGLVKFVFKPNEYNTIKLSYNKYNDGGNRQLAGEKGGSNTISNDPHNEISRNSYTLNYKYSPNNDIVNFETKIYTSSQELEVVGGKNRDYWLWPDFADEPTISFENKASGLDLRNTSFINTHKLTYGASFDKTEQSAKADGPATYINTGESVNLSVNGGKTKEYALYLEDEIELDKFLLTFGARYDIHKLGGVYFGKNSQISPKFKGEYQAFDDLKFRVGYGKIFKGAPLGETTMLVYGVSVNTKDIKAQTGNNYEVGFDYNLSSVLNADNSIFGFTAYTYNVDNYMHPTKNLKLNSLGDVNVWGLESVFKYKKSNTALSLSHTYTKGDIKDLDSGDVYDHLTSNIHTFKADIDYRLNKEFYFNYNAEFVPENKIKNSWQTEKVKRAGYTIHNISTTYNPTAFKGAKILFGIDNVFDKKYQRHTSFGAYWGDPDFGPYEVGRNFKVNLSYKF